MRSVPAMRARPHARTFSIHSATASSATASGAAQIQYSTVSVYDSKFSFNAAKVNGGALRLKGANLKFVNLEMKNNSAIDGDDIYEVSRVQKEQRFYVIVTFDPIDDNHPVLLPLVTVVLGLGR